MLTQRVILKHFNLSDCRQLVINIIKVRSRIIERIIGRMDNAGIRLPNVYHEGRWESGKDFCIGVVVA